MAAIVVITAGHSHDGHGHHGVMGTEEAGAAAMVIGTRTLGITMIAITRRPT